jgi:anti-sigma regulatory factor (Ser/Thr protein kinase)
MAGSYNHCVADDGQLFTPKDLVQMIENLGDAYEAIEEMYGMIWLLADGDADRVEDAERRYGEGLVRSPGTGGSLPRATMC